MLMQWCSTGLYIGCWENDVCHDTANDGVGTGNDIGVQVERDDGTGIKDDAGWCLH